jgi:SPP1 gp7 family putative phage head morphogenesis protein
MIANGSKLDPTRTSGIRRQFEAALKLRYRALKAMIVDLIYSRDVLGLGDSGTPRLRFNAFLVNTSPGEIKGLVTDPKKYEDKVIHHFTTEESAGKVISSGYVKDSDGLEGTAAYFTEDPGGTVSRSKSSVRLDFRVQKDSKIVELATGPGNMDVGGWMREHATDKERDEDNVAGTMRRLGVDAIRLSRKGGTEHWWLVANPDQFKIASAVMPGENLPPSVPTPSPLQLPPPPVLVPMTPVPEPLALAPPPLEPDEPEPSPLPMGISTPGLSNPNKVKRFRAWLRGKMDSTLAGDALIQQYIDQGYRRGTERAFDDLRRGGIMTGEGEQADLKRQGAKEEFSRIAMTKSATVEKVKLLAGRTFHELEDINTKMSARMSRVLVDALVQGWSPAKAAREMVKQVDLDISRATVIVRTELVRAHSEGQLDALEMLGETEVGVMAEWITAHDGKVCPRCKALEGQTFSITDARGMLPLHPRCRCAWVPLRKRRGKVR